jgi:hypothetical protein
MVNLGIRGAGDRHQSVLFVVFTVSFRLLCALFVIRHGRREIVHLNVTEHPTATRSPSAAQARGSRLDSDVGLERDPPTRTWRGVSGCHSAHRRTEL